MSKLFETEPLLSNRSTRPSLQVALVEPEIPANTGNIARTCVATGSSLHICGTPGFSLEDKYLKRAALDFWYQLDLTLWDRFTDLQKAEPGMNFYYATTKAERLYTELDASGPVCLVFGKETKGLPEEMLLAHPERCVRIPMLPEIRSLNLSNSVAIMVYEVLRQRNFAGLEIASRFLTEHFEPQ